MKRSMIESIQRKAQVTARTQRRSFTSDREQRQYDHEVLEVARVVRVVKGGRRFRFRASVIVGDRSGKVGLGIGKSRDVQEAIRQAYDHGIKHMVEVPLRDGTIPHLVRAKFKGADVLLRPARSGSGVIAGGAVRVVADLAGIQDLVSKMYGSSNRISNVRATLKALGEMKKIEKRK